LIAINWRSGFQGVRVFAAQAGHALADGVREDGKALGDGGGFAGQVYWPTVFSCWSE
jgi:hypothetical protein